MVAAVAAASWLNCCCSRSHQACDADCAAWLTCSAVEAGSADAAAPPAGWLRDSGAAAPGCAGVAGFKPSATSSGDGLPPAAPLTNDRRVAMVADRKSTRLNSSHVKISYAVFCLKKKTNVTIKERSAGC